MYTYSLPLEDYDAPSAGAIDDKCCRHSRRTSRRVSAPSPFPLYRYWRHAAPMIGGRWMLPNAWYTKCSFYIIAFDVRESRPEISLCCISLWYSEMKRRFGRGRAFGIRYFYLILNISRYSKENSDLPPPEREAPPRHCGEKCKVTWTGTFIPKRSARSTAKCRENTAFTSLPLCYREFAAVAFIDWRRLTTQPHATTALAPCRARIDRRLITFNIIDDAPICDCRAMAGWRFDAEQAVKLQKKLLFISFSPPEMLRCAFWWYSPYHLLPMSTHIDVLQHNKCHYRHRRLIYIIYFSACASIEKCRIYA